MAPLRLSQRRPPSIRGILMNISALRQLCADLFDRFGFDCFYSSRINSDDIENEFCMIRSANGLNDHPHPMLFVATVRARARYQIGKPTGNGNCDAAVSKQLFDLTELAELVAEDNDETEEEAIEEEQECIDITTLPEYVNVSPSDCSSLQYVLGYTGKSLLHEECRQSFTMANDQELNYDINIHIQNKKFDENSNLCVPSFNSFEIARDIKVRFAV